jgi:hypothetical protein
VLAFVRERGTATLAALRRHLDGAVPDAGRRHASSDLVAPADLPPLLAEAVHLLLDEGVLAEEPGERPGPGHVIRLAV